MSTILPRRSISLDFVRDGQASGANYPTELSKLDPLFTFARSSVATRFNSTGQLETVGHDQPRFDFDPVTRQCKGLLLEAQKSNYIWPSNNFGHANWGKVGVNVGATVPGPDGTMSGTVLSPTTGDSRIEFNHIVTAGTAYTGSIWLRVASGTKAIRIFLYDHTLNETLGYADVTITTAWTRFSVSAVTGAGSAGNLVGFFVGSGGTWSSGDIEVAWAQWELGLYPTSYIPTTTSAGTRVADSLYTTQIAPWFNAAAGTYFIDFSEHGLDTSFPRVFEARAADGNNLAAIFLNIGYTGGASMAYVTCGAAAAEYHFGAVSGARRVASSYTLTRAAFSANGAVAAADLSFTPPGYLTRLTLGNRQEGDSAFSGYLRRFNYLPFAVSDILLQQMTA
jgi:hypothetical protein